MPALTPHQISRYGWRGPSLRSLLLPQADPSELQVHDEVDPRNEYMTPVYDQLQAGTCTANADAAQIDADRIVNGEQPFFPSRLGIYSCERIIEGSPLTADTGAQGGDGLVAASQWGLLPESAWAYTDDITSPLFTTDPRPQIAAAVAAGTGLKLARPFKSVAQDDLSIKQVLSNKQTITFGFVVYESFESAEVARTGIMPVPNPSQEAVVGGHEVICVGYLKSEPGYYLVRNSWNTTWGIGGYFLMPSSVLLSSSLSSDLKTIYRPGPAPGPKPGPRPSPRKRRRRKICQLLGRTS